MNVLLDTHLAFWWQIGDPRLTPNIRAVIEMNNQPVFVSQVSLWELTIKASIGKVCLDLPTFAAQVETMGFVWLPIKNAHILQLTALPFFAEHKDPFDRLLVAQAISESLILLTVDSQLARYGTPVRVM